MRLGQAFWDPISGATSISADMVPYLIMNLSCMGTEEFMNMIKEMTAGTKRWKEAISNAFSRTKYDKEYGDFETDLATKRKENMISDSYFTEEELMGGFTDGRED